MAIRYFDLFSGIGGFRSGLNLAGGFECVGHCEIDPYANADTAKYDVAFAIAVVCYIAGAVYFTKKDLPL